MNTELDTAVERACALIAPTWPLDRFIAVNPWWPRISKPLPTVSAELAARSGARLLMPRTWFQEQWRNKHFQLEHLREAIAQTQANLTLPQLLTVLENDAPTPPRRARVVDVVDAQRDLSHTLSWRDFVVHSISQHCASYFDEAQAQLHPERRDGLFASWRHFATVDESPSLLMGFTAFRQRAQTLPLTAKETIGVALTELQVPPSERDAYLESLLLDVNGWASWCAYRRWSAELAGSLDDHLADLLAIRLAWDWLLLAEGGPSTATRWHATIASWPAIEATAHSSQAPDWVLQRAVEIAGQHQLARQLPAALRSTTKPLAPAFQAVFCIDVRSEVFRRALEAHLPSVQTIGFAGFFGLPIAYQPVGASAAHPQLPGLLAPSLQVTDQGTSQHLAQRRSTRLEATSTWHQFKTSPVSNLSFVEALGAFFVGKLVGDSFGRPRPTHDQAALTPAEHATRKPRLTTRTDGAELTAEQRTLLAESMLRTMSLTQTFAPLVLLVGHGSQTYNNPHAAGLDCGACGGQTGEVNARAAAALLNEPLVRAGLRARGIEVPEHTHFLAGLHTTTTDEVTLFDLDELPASLRAPTEVLRAALDQATKQARRERAAADAPDTAQTDEQLAAAARARATDWACVRPEWGLANNAAFIVAPREHSRSLNLAGRAFLHDYHFDQDPGHVVLERIMTAPMVVTQWINLQYYASTVDNLRYGSGNKVLHNVVGGHLGVFEGNGGDLRIGLPLQSLHDGQRWRHTPVRLNVFIEAPCDAIDSVLAKHDSVRALVDNEWLYLFQLDAGQGLVRQRRSTGWVTLSPLDA